MLKRLSNPTIPASDPSSRAEANGLREVLDGWDGVVVVSDVLADVLTDVLTDVSDDLAVWLRKGDLLSIVLASESAPGGITLMTRHRQLRQPS